MAGQLTAPAVSAPPHTPAPTYKIIRILRGPSSGGVDSVAFSPGGKTLAAGDWGGTTYLWNLATHTNTATRSRHA